MYYTGINPDTMQEVYVPKSKREKQLQRALMQYRKKENYNLVKEALIEAGRQDLIGFKESCLIKPLKEEAKSGYIEQKLNNVSGKKAVKTRSGVVYVDQAKIDKINSAKKRAKGKSTPKKRGKK